MNKKYVTLVAFLLITHVVLCQYEWTWVSGEQSENVDRVYGGQGIPTPLNNPGSRIGTAFWTDKNGNLWLFGGRGNRAGDGLLSDLWKYDISTGYWTWMGGRQTENAYGSYETQGTPSPGNNPGARLNGVYWTDANGDFWLFGGRGLPSDDDDDDDDDDDESLLNDLWKYSVETGQWTFVSGTDRRNQSGRYGDRMEASVANYPGARYSASGWIDGIGNLWLFGGRGYTSEDDISILSDVWKYNPADNTWTWIIGNQSGNEAINYGEKGLPANSNTPGGRHGCISWRDNNGVFWLYGGGTLTDLFADLWTFDPLSTRWTWVSGSTTPNQQPKFTTRGVAEPDAHPGSRTLSAVWIDSVGDVLFFGGNGYGGAGGSRPLNNLWKYSGRTNEWTFLTGEISVNPTATYGTKGQPAPENTPGGTASPAFWKDNDGNFWLFGGRSGEGYLDQVWKLSVGCGEISGTITPATSTICTGGSQVLTATGGTAYEWSLNGVVIPGATGATINASLPGTYSVIVKNNNCSGPASNTAVVTLATAPTGTITPASATICKGGAQLLTATGGTSYQWRRNGVLLGGQTSATFNVTEPGTYSVDITNGTCVGPASNESVVTLQNIEGIRYADTTIAANTSVQLTARDIGKSYSWSPVTGLDDPLSRTPTLTTTTGGEYFVAITTNEGCVVTDSQLVKILGDTTTEPPAPPPPAAEKKKGIVPTAFSPDGNNVNDVLRPLGNLRSVQYFKVYNRWGTLLFETNQLGKGWDGMYRGIKQPAETYTWVLVGVSGDGQVIKQTGKTLLIR